MPARSTGLHPLELGLLSAAPKRPVFHRKAADFVQNPGMPKGMTPYWFRRYKPPKWAYYQRTLSGATSPRGGVLQNIINVLAQKEGSGQSMLLKTFHDMKVQTEDDGHPPGDVFSSPFTTPVKMSSASPPMPSQQFTPTPPPMPRLSRADISYHGMQAETDTPGSEYAP